jgi:hypothetical protein
MAEDNIASGFRGGRVRSPLPPALSSVSGAALEGKARGQDIRAKFRRSKKAEEKKGTGIASDPSVFH